MFSLFQAKYEDFRAQPSPISTFLRSIEAYTVKTCKKLNWDRYILCDELPMAVAILGSDVIKECVTCYAAVETAGHLTRAQMVVDWDGTLKKRDNVHIIKELNVDLYMKCIGTVYK